MVVVVLGVFLERMVVAAGTADPHPEERLRRGVGRLRFDRLLLADRDDPPPYCWRGIAGREHVARQVIPRPVDRHLAAQPGVERPHPLHPADIVIPLLPVLEEIGELERPEVGELRSFKQPFHQQRPLVGGSVGKKGPHLLCIRQRADEVEHQAPQERGVVAIIRRGNMEGLQLLHHMVVDDIAARGKPLRRHLLRKRARDHDGVDEAGIGDDDRHLAMLLPAHNTLGRDRRIGGVVGMKTGQRRHLLLGAVAPGGPDHKLPHFAGGKNDLLRRDTDSHDAPLVGDRAWRPGGDPIDQRPRRGTVD